MALTKGKEGKRPVEVEQQQPKRKWEWERKMEEDQGKRQEEEDQGKRQDALGSGKQVGHDRPATVSGKPMDEGLCV